MKTRTLTRKYYLPLCLIALMTLTSACAEQVAGPRAWIDFPMGGSAVAVGTPVAVVAHAYAPDGVAEMTLSVNGAAYRRSPPAKPGNSFTDARLEWLPQQEGNYILQVTAHSRNGDAVNAHAISVRAIGKATATPVGPTPVGVTPVVITPGHVTPVSSASDLAIVSVEAVAGGYKGAVPVCDIRVVYRNAGTVPVPSDYVIQAALDGRPFASMTRGAGFGVGGTSEAIFFYQFTGSAYIGINLDSTDVIAESNETNNAFAEIRQCGAALPLITLVVPPTPTRTPTVGIIQVAPPTSHPPTPTFTPTRTPTRTPTPPDTTAPPAPHQVSPSGTLSCRGSVTLDWNSVSDPSGIKTYYVKLERQISQGNWQSAGGWTTSSTAQSVSVQCGGVYRWQVRAEDNAGNDGPWSGMMNFSINLP